jgi:hypothetical protein
MYLFQEIFYEKDPLRMEEYIYCINKNIDNPLIEKIFLVYDATEFSNNVFFFTNILSTRIKKNEKILLLPSLNKRFTFGFFALYANVLLPEGSIVAVSNLDTFIPDTPAWAEIEKEFFSIVKNKACLALCRTEYINDIWQYIEEESWKNGEFADCWVFKTPLNFTQKDFPFDVAVGNAPSCDNFMFGFLNEKYKKVFNWAEKYTVYHFDLVRKPSKLVNKHNIMITNEDTLHFPHNDYNSGRLSPYQDWEQILNNEFIIKKEEKSNKNG